MVPSLPDTPALQLVLGAFASGDVYLVTEDAHTASFEEMLDVQCWAHLKDARDGNVYVQELRRGSRELLAPRYLEMLELNV